MDFLIRNSNSSGWNIFEFTDIYFIVFLTKEKGKYHTKKNLAGWTFIMFMKGACQYLKSRVFHIIL